MAEVSIEYASHLPSSAMMASAARSVCALPEASEREDAVATLFKLLHGVLAMPTDAKKRRVKKSNETFHRKVGRHECAVEFLRSCGFLDADDPDAGREGQGALLTMPVAYIVRLTDAHHSLASAAEQAQLTVPPLPHCPVFNPYSSSSTALNSTNQPKASKGFKDEIERIERELKDKNAAMQAKVDSAPPVPLNPTVFWAAAGVRLEEIVRDTASVGDEEKGDNTIIGSQIGNVKAALNGTNGKFESAAKRALADLNKKEKRVHQTCIIRVTCPDKSVLQVHFRANDKGEHVLSQIAPLLAPHIRETSWYLYQSPPMKKLLAKETLAAAGFPPGANLYIGFDGEKPGTPFFEASLQATLGPAPEDQTRGVNSIAGHLSGEAMGWGAGKALGSAEASAAEVSASDARRKAEAAAASRILGAGKAPEEAEAPASEAPASEAAAALPVAAPMFGGAGQRLGGGPAPMDVDKS